MKEQVCQIVSQVMGIPTEQISEESSSDTIKAWDSLKHMDLVLALEEEFNVTFNEKQIVEMLSVGAIIEAIKSVGGGN